MSEGAKASDLNGCAKYTVGRELPIVCTNKVIKFRSYAMIVLKINLLLIPSEITS